MQKCFLIMAALLALVTAGCASMSQEECQSVNWLTKGKTDGMEGKKATRIADYQKSCSKFGIQVNDTQYLKGHKEGLKYFCTYENGLRKGRLGISYDGLCSEVGDREYLRGHKAGMKEYELEQERIRQEEIAKEKAAAAAAVAAAKAKALADAKLVECKVDSDCIINHDRCMMAKDNVKRCTTSHILCTDDPSCRVGGQCVPDKVCVGPGNCFKTKTCRFMKQKEVSY